MKTKQIISCGVIYTFVFACVKSRFSYGAAQITVPRGIWTGFQIIHKPSLKILIFFFYGNCKVLIILINNICTDIILVKFYAIKRSEHKNSHMAKIR